MCHCTLYSFSQKHIHMMQKKPLDTWCEREGGREGEIMMVEEK